MSPGGRRRDRVAPRGGALRDGGSIALRRGACDRRVELLQGDGGGLGSSLGICGAHSLEPRDERPRELQQLRELQLQAGAREIRGVMAGRQMYQRGPQAVQVGRWGGAAHQLLGRHVAVGADHGRAAAGLQREVLLDRAEVDDRHAAVRGAEQVGGLQVAMDHGRVELVQPAQHLEHPPRQVDRLVLTPTLPLKQRLFQRRGVDQLGDEVELPVIGEGVDELRDAWVIQLAVDLRLALEEPTAFQLSAPTKRKCLSATRAPVSESRAR